MAYGVLAAALVGYLVVVTPSLGKRTYDRLVRDRDRDPGALVRLYRLWIGETWAVTAVALVVAWLTPGLDAARIGLRLDGGTSLIVGALAGLVLGMAISALAARKAPGGGLPFWPSPRATAVAYAALLPRTSAERWHAVAMSVTAGVCEEIVYRGVLIALGTHLLGLPVPAAAALALAVFVIGHLYQGVRGMVMVAVAGISLTLLYLNTGSLLLPVLVHIAVDLRSLAFPPHGEPREAATTVSR